MIRQYIGARYVPKFYENPNGSSEWLPNVIYEPLTVVTYDSNSYTSKKTVPASVGIPANNPEYWVATGNYNAFIHEIQNEISDINTALTPITSKLNLLDGAYVTPEAYGAVGDGVADDTAALTTALTHKNVICTKVYKVTDSIDVYAENIIGGTFIYDGDPTDKLFIFKDQTAVNIDEISIDGNNKVGIALDFEYNVDKNSITVTNCVIKNLSSATDDVIGIYIKDIVYAAEISNNTIDNVHHDASNIVAVAGIWIVRLFGSANITNNTISNIITASTQDADGIKVFNLRKSLTYDMSVSNIAHNNMFNCNGRFVKVQGRNANINNNSFHLSNVTMINVPAMIETQFNGCTIKNNTALISNATCPGSRNVFAKLAIYEAYPNPSDIQMVIENNDVTFNEFELAFFYMELFAAPNDVYVDIVHNKINGFGLIANRLSAKQITGNVHVNISDNQFDGSRLINLGYDFKEHEDSTKMALVQDKLSIKCTGNQSKNDHTPIFDSTYTLPCKLIIHDNVNFDETIYGWNWSFNKLYSSVVMFGNDGHNTNNELADLPKGLDSKFAKNTFIEGLSKLSNNIVVRMSSSATASPFGETVTVRKYLV